MYIVVIGLGQVGRHLLSVLEREGHDIVAIDSDPEAVRWVEDHHDVMTLTGYGASESILEKAQVGRADLVVAVTDNDEINLIAALSAKDAGADRTVARTQGNEWARSRQGVRYGLLGVDVVINPSVLVAHELVKVARSHGAIEVIDLAQDRLELVQVNMTEDSNHAHRPVSSIPFPRDTLVAAVVRDGTLFVPGGADVVQPDDRVYLLGRPSDLPAAEDLFNRERRARRALIVGGGVTGETAARELVEDGASVVIIESNRRRAEELSGTLEGVSVLHGDGTDRTLLEEEEVGTYDLFAAVTSDDEVNLMAALLAQRMGAQRTAALMQRPDYMPIYRELGIQIVLSPRTVASNHILRWCRRTELRSLSVLQDGQAEVLEIPAKAGARILNKPLKDLSLPRGAIIGAIVKADSVVVPRGDDVIEAGDDVVVLVTAAARPTVERLFRPGLL